MDIEKAIADLTDRVTALEQAATAKTAAQPVHKTVDALLSKEAVAPVPVPVSAPKAD